MESLEVAERVPPEQEIHVSYLAVYPLSNEGCDTVAIDTAVGTCSASLIVRRRGATEFLSRSVQIQGLGPLEPALYRPVC